MKKFLVLAVLALAGLVAVPSAAAGDTTCTGFLRPGSIAGRFGEQERSLLLGRHALA